MKNRLIWCISLINLCSLLWWHVSSWMLHYICMWRLILVWRDSVVIQSKQRILLKHACILIIMQYCGNSRNPFFLYLTTKKVHQQYNFISWERPLLIILNHENNGLIYSFQILLNVIWKTLKRVCDLKPKLITYTWLVCWFLSIVTCNIIENRWIIIISQIVFNRRILLSVLKCTIAEVFVSVFVSLFHRFIKNIINTPKK